METLVETRKCVFCGKDFQPHDRNSIKNIYCSPKCRSYQTMYNWLYRAKVKGGTVN